MKGMPLVPVVGAFIDASPGSIYLFFRLAVFIPLLSVELNYISLFFPIWCGLRFRCPFALWLGPFFRFTQEHAPKQTSPLVASWISRVASFRRSLSIPTLLSPIYLVRKRELLPSRKIPVPFDTTLPGIEMELTCPHRSALRVGREGCLLPPGMVQSKYIQ